MEDRTFSGRKLGWKFKDVANRRSTETIHALVIISDNADIFIVSCKQEHELLLNVIRVLILIDHNITDTVLNPLKHIRMLHEHLPSPGLNGREIHDTLSLEEFPVPDNDLSEELHVLVTVRKEGIYIRELLHDHVHVAADFLCLLPAASEWNILRIIRQTAESLDIPADQIGLLEGIHHPERLFIINIFGVFFQEPEAYCMKRPDIHLIDIDLRIIGKELVRYSGQELPRGFFGECHSHDLAGGNVFLQNEIRDSFYKGECLAGPESGNDKNRPFRLSDGRLLFIICVGQIKHTRLPYRIS